MAKRDYYEVLGVPRGASEADIKKAFRTQARLLHPDTNKDDPNAAEKFKEANEAYQVLTDADRRAKYDQFGHAAEQMGGGGGSPFEGMNPNDPGFGDIFDMFFSGGQGRKQRGPARGNDLQYQLDLTLQEAAFGLTKELKVPRTEDCETCNGSGAKPGTQPKACPKCKGSGQVQSTQSTIFGRFVNVTTCDRCRGEGKQIEHPCTTCRGRGRVQKTHRVDLNIPGGVETGSRMRMSGYGEIGERGGPPGDLYIIMNVKPDPRFQRQDDDLISKLTISYVQAALGTEIEVPTLDGPESVKVPEGSQHGDTIRLKGKGVKRLRGGGRGDQHVVLTVSVPTKLLAKERELLRELAELRGETVTHSDKGFLGKVKDAFGNL